MAGFEGKVVVISGAGQGQGRSHAVRYAEEGARIVLFDVARQLERQPYEMASEEDLQETVRLVKAAGGEVVSGIADVRDFAEVTRVVEDGIAAFGPPDIVIANAGIISEVAKTWEMDPQDFRDVVDVNLIGTWHTLRATLPSMVEAGRGGSVIVTTSCGGLKPLPNISNYVASKLAVIGLMKSTAIELAPHGIRANCVAPASTNTKMFVSDFTKRLFVPDMEEPSDEVFFERAAALSPMGVPMIESIDITEAILWLTSDAARYVTGTVLPVDSGTLLL